EDGQVTRVHLELPGVRYDVLDGGIALLNGGGITRLRGPVIVHEEDRGIRTDRELASQAIVRPLIAEDPAAGVHVKDGREYALRLRRPDDANPHRPGGSPRKGGVFDLRGGLVDGSLLDLDEHCPSGIRAQRVERRSPRCGERIDEGLRTRFKHW